MSHSKFAQFTAYTVQIGSSFMVFKGHKMRYHIHIYIHINWGTMDIDKLVRHEGSGIKKS